MNGNDLPSEGFLRNLFFDDPWPIVRKLFDPDDRPETLKRYREFQTAAGSIDLLLVWERSVLVIEFKRESIDEGAVAQCLRYMGAMGAEFGFGSNILRGVVIAPGITRNGQFASQAAGVSYLRARFVAAVDEIEWISSDRKEPRDEITYLVYPELKLPPEKPLAVPDFAGKP